MTAQEEARPDSVAEVSPDPAGTTPDPLASPRAASSESGKTRGWRFIRTLGKIWNRAGRTDDLSPGAGRSG